MLSKHESRGKEESLREYFLAHHLSSPNLELAYQNMHYSSINVKIERVELQGEKYTMKSYTIKRLTPRVPQL